MSLQTQAQTAVTRTPAHLGGSDAWRRLLRRVDQVGRAHALRPDADRSLVAMARTLSGVDRLPRAIHRWLVDFDAEGYPMVWQTLYESRFVRVGVMRLSRGHCIPPHDHCQACGAMRVLSGQVRVHHYTAGPVTGVRQLHRTSVRDLGHSELDTVRPGPTGVHSLQGIGERSLLLDILVPPYDTADRYWYLPTEPEETGETLNVLPVRLDRYRREQSGQRQPPTQEESP